MSCWNFCSDCLRCRLQNIFRRKEIVCDISVLDIIKHEQLNLVLFLSCNLGKGNFLALPPKGNPKLWNGWMVQKMKYLLGLNGEVHCWCRRRGTITVRTEEIWTQNDCPVFTLKGQEWHIGLDETKEGQGQIANPLLGCSYLWSESLKHTVCHIPYTPFKFFGEYLLSHEF